MEGRHTAVKRNVRSVNKKTYSFKAAPTGKGDFEYSVKLDEDGNILSVKSENTALVVSVTGKLSENRSVLAKLSKVVRWTTIKFKGYFSRKMEDLKECMEDEYCFDAIVKIKMFVLLNHFIETIKKFHSTENKIA